MHAVLFAALFFETSSEEECDLDMAVKQLEQIAWSLGQLSHEEQEQFRAFAHRTAESHSSPAIANEIVSLVDGLLTAPDE
jgi:hypothetical protein